MIYFDNAATTGKKPIIVLTEVNNALKNYNANPGRSGHTLSEKTAEKIYRVREKVSNFFGCSEPENVIFTMNCTHAINCVIKGVLKQEDHIIISSLEHNSVLRPVVKSGAQFDIARVDLNNDFATIQNFKNLIKPNTKMIFCTGASNVTGKLLPIDQIGEICRQRNILFGVDAAQIAGVIPIDMEKSNIDFLCVAPHKALYAPTGVGILIARKYIENTLIEGGTGSNSAEYFQPKDSPERYESGTVNISGIFGIGAGIDFVNSMGVNKIYSHELDIVSKIYSRLSKNKNIILYTPFPKSKDYAPVLSFNFKGIPSEKTARLLSDYGVAVRGGLHCAPLAHEQLNTLSTGTVRISVSRFNTVNEAEYFLSVISSENFLKNLKK